jgi:hypothetical protein
VRFHSNEENHYENVKVLLLKDGRHLFFKEGETRGSFIVTENVIMKE